MCGRYELNLKEQNSSKLYGRFARLIGLAEKRQGLAAPSGEIRPSDTAPVLLLGQGEIQAQQMAWGFASPKGSGLVINARSETAGERPMFRRRLRNGRCIVPATGFYEWSHSGKKEKHCFRRPDKGLLYMAGLYGLTETGGRFVILTTAAGEAMSGIHDRQPVILNEEEAAQWLSDEGRALSLLRRDETAGPELSRERLESGQPGDSPEGEYEQLTLPFL